MPMGFMPNKNNEDQTSLLGFTDVTLVLYTPENESVLSLAIQHREKYVCGEALSFVQHIETKGALNIGDKMISLYSCVRAIRKCSFWMFVELADTTQ
jgi:hypothetical protein